MLAVSQSPGCCGVHVIHGFAGEDWEAGKYEIERDTEELKRRVKENEKLVGALQVNLVTRQNDVYGKVLEELGFVMCASGENSKSGKTIYTYMRSRPTIKKKIGNLLKWEKK